jgi:hypothetical protein
MDVAPQSGHRKSRREWSESPVSVGVVGVSRESLVCHVAQADIGGQVGEETLHILDRIAVHDLVGTDQVAADVDVVGGADGKCRRVGGVWEPFTHGQHKQRSEP